MMIYILWIFCITASSQAIPVPADETATVAALQATSNSTSPAPKETSYFYRDPKGPGTYEFGYRIEDEETGNIQFREETRYANGTIIGKYGYLRPDGKMTITSYVADEKGYRAKTNVTKHSSSFTTPAPSNVTNHPSPSTTPAPSSTTTITTEIPSLNLTSGTLPPQLVEDVMNQYQIDLRPNANPSDILHPNITDIINGKVPLTMDNNNFLGFEVVHNFIPKDFPIIPFQLPTELPPHPIDD